MSSTGSKVNGAGWKRAPVIRTRLRRRRDRAADRHVNRRACQASRAEDLPGEVPQTWSTSGAAGTTRMRSRINRTSGDAVRCYDGMPAGRCIRAARSPPHWVALYAPDAGDAKYDLVSMEPTGSDEHDSTSAEPPWISMCENAGYALKDSCADAAYEDTPTRTPQGGSTGSWARDRLHAAHQRCGSGY